ncbi:hypothetical protein HBA55_27060 [Pseudomaricurvus alkylphenolicus]|jgi:hypothetical protein|uniref:hypothetical protein n=1 Tax=Pseudomaricurvus alkylphenolicus TaxID=1306991 RepID=UPI00141F707B|nr:hypothetical protein [Pseudomaricurvus alkylphenolicus]NIB43297.1 hypothetical protein [Pseudomaricurvus alkylphenolicus]
MTTPHLAEKLNRPQSPGSQPICKIALPIDDAAKLAALNQIYPGRDTQALITELLHHALNTLESDQKT